MIRGRGERVEVVKLGWRGWIVLLLPGFSVPTGRVYGAWEPVEPPGDRAGAGTEEIGSDRLAVEWMEKAYNMLEAAAMRVAPALEELVDRSAVLAARPVRVSGSGATLFTAFDTRSEAQRFAELASEELRLSTRVVQLVKQA